MKVVDTSKWMLPPRAGRSFRVGQWHYRCWLRIGPWAVISRL